MAGQPEYSASISFRHKRKKALSSVITPLIKSILEQEYIYFWRNMDMRDHGWINPVSDLINFPDASGDLYSRAYFEGSEDTMSTIENDEVVERIGRLERGERKRLYLRDFSDNELCLIVETCGEYFLEFHFAG